MNSLYFKPLLVVASVFWGSTIYGQQTWTLTQCLDFAQKNHPVLLQSENNLEKSGLKVKSAYNVCLPTVQARFNTTIENNGFATVKNAPKQGVLEIPFEILNWKNILNISWSKLYYKSAVYQLKVNVLEQNLTIVKSFYQYQYDRFWQELLKSQILGIEEQIKRIEKEVQIGNRPKSDIYDARANFSTMQEQWYAAVNQQQIAKNELQHAIGIFDAQLDFVAIHLDGFKNEKIQIENINLEKHPLFVVANYQQKMAQKNLQLARSDYFPRLTTSYNYTFFNENNASQVSNVLQMGFEIPLFNGFLTKNKLTLAKLEIKNAIFEKERLGLNLKRDFLNLESHYKIALAKLELLEANFENQRLSFQKSEEKYREGMMDSYTFFVVRNAWLQANFNLIKSKLDVQLQYETLSLLAKALV